MDNRYSAFQGGRTRGNFNFNGDLILDGSITCEKCNGKNIFKGSYDTEHERLMYAEIGGEDAGNNFVTPTEFYVCLDCEHMGHSTTQNKIKEDK